MHERGLEVKPEWIRRGQGCFDYGYQATLEILDLPKEIRPTALIAMNDLMAVGAIQAAKSRGVAVGRDFAVGGFDDYPMTQYIDPPLTTLRQPIIEVGKQIITMLLEVINGENNSEPRTIMLNPELVIRGSTVRN